MVFAKKLRQVRANCRLASRRNRLLALLLAAVTAVLVGATDPAPERAAMIAAVESMYRETRRSTGLGSMSPAVRAAMEKVERHRFVTPGQAARAYSNQPLSIGHGQTISQPYIVA